MYETMPMPPPSETVFDLNSFLGSLEQQEELNTKSQTQFKPFFDKPYTNYDGIESIYFRADTDTIYKCLNTPGNLKKFQASKKFQPNHGYPLVDRNSEFHDDI